MSRRPTVADIARVSGVSVATIDRVLNGRLPVKPETAERVFAAAEQIGYHGAGLIRRRLEQNLPHHRFGFLLQRPDQLFYQDFARALEYAPRHQLSSGSRPPSPSCSPRLPGKLPSA